MEYCVAAKRSAVLAALLTLSLAASASAAIVEFGPPNTMPQTWGSTYANDMALVPVSTADTVPDIITDLSDSVTDKVQIRSSNVFGEYRQIALPGYNLSVQEISVSGKPAGLEVADANGDGNPDIAVASSAGVWLARGTGSGSFTSLAGPTSNPVIERSDVKLARLYGDNLPDLVTVRPSGLDIYFNTGNASTPYAAPSSYVDYTGGSKLALADFTNDGSIDVAMSMPADQRILFAFEDPPSTTPFREPRSIGLFTRLGAMTAANVSGDSRNELIVTEPDRASVAVISTASLPVALGPITRIPTGAGPVSVTTADLDGNGTAEVITANVASDSVTVAEVGGASKTFPAGPSPNNVNVGNMNADGRPDLLTSNDGAVAVSSLVNLGVPVPPAPAPVIVRGKASLKCSTKSSKKKVREVSCTATLTKKADAKSLSAVLSLGKKKVKTVKASVGKKLAFKFPKGLKAGKYSVKLTVTNKDGTKLTASKTVKVK